MRTTVDLDEDVLKVARSLAASRQISLGKALSHLARQGIQWGGELPPDDLFPTFNVGADDPLVTPDQVNEALEER